MATQAIRAAARRAWRSPVGSGIPRELPRMRAGQLPLVGAVGAGLGLALLGTVVFKLAPAARLDADASRGFWMMQRPSLAALELKLIHTVNEVPVAAAAAALAAVALVRRRPKLLVPIGVIVLGANLSTQALKAMLPAHTLPASPIFTGPSFPSGHATACMSLVLCAVIVAPARARPVVAALGSLYSLLLGYSLLVANSHLPSDVIAGFLMAFIWALLALAISSRAGDVPAQGPVFAAGSAVTPLAWVVALAIAAAGLAIATGPTAVPVVPFAVVATVIALVAAVGCGAVAELSLRPGVLPASSGGSS